MYTTIDTPISRAALASLLSAAGNARICLIGDLCLDMYWMADMRLSEISRETPHFPLPVVEERFSPGGAGNVACNIAALKPARLTVVGLAGTDWRGGLLMESLQKRGIDTSCIIRHESITTNTYIKPLRRGISDVIYEDPRLDFENRASISEQCEEMVLESLEKAASDADVICVSDQMRFGCITHRVRERLSRMGAEGKTVIVDSRDHISDYRFVIKKPNDVEASRVIGCSGALPSLEKLAAMAAAASLHDGCPFIITLGEKGCFVAVDGDVVRCPACPVEPPIDFCGAGDTFLSAFGVMLSAGASPGDAAQVANICSAVTIKKIGTTGTATPCEVLDAWDTYYSRKEN